MGEGAHLLVDAMRAEKRREGLTAAHEEHPELWQIPYGWTLDFRRETGSTSDDARQGLRMGCSSRTIFLADAQTAGRGRYGRPWLAPAGTCLLFSMALRESVTPVDLTGLCANAVVESIAQETGLQARIKWPNDVMIGGLKVCGILTEVVAGAGPPAVVVGIGINVNVHPEAAGLPPTATSLAAELGSACSRSSIFTAVVAGVDGYLSLDRDSLREVVRKRWEQRLWRRKQWVHLADGSSFREGVVEGISESGALLLRTADATLVEVSTGELLPEG